MLGIVLLVRFQDPAFFAIGLTYILSGPFVWIMERRKGIATAAVQESQDGS